MNIDNSEVNINQDSYLHSKPYGYFLSNSYFDRQTRLLLNSIIKKLRFKLLEENKTNKTLKIICSSESIQQLTIKELEVLTSCNCDKCISNNKAKTIFITSDPKPERSKAYQNLLLIQSNVIKEVKSTDVTEIVISKSYFDQLPVTIISGFAIKKIKGKINAKLTNLKMRVVTQSKQKQTFTVLCKNLIMHEYTTSSFLAIKNCACNGEDKTKLVEFHSDFSNEEKLVLESRGYKINQAKLAKTSLVYEVVCSHGNILKLTKAQLLCKKYVCPCIAKIQEIKDTQVIKESKELKQLENVLTCAKKFDKVPKPLIPTYYLLPRDQNDEIINNEAQQKLLFNAHSSLSSKNYFNAYIDILLRTPIKLNTILFHVDMTHIVQKLELLKKSKNLTYPLTIDYVIPLRLFDLSNIEHIQFCTSEQNVRIISVIEKEVKSNGIRYQDFEYIKSNKNLNHIYFNILKLR